MENKTKNYLEQKIVETYGILEDKEDISFSILKKMSKDGKIESSDLEWFLSHYKSCVETDVCLIIYRENYDESLFNEVHEKVKKERNILERMLNGYLKRAQW